MKVVSNGRKAYTFTGWNTVSDGSGTSYNAGDTFTIDSVDVVFYVQWLPDTASPFRSRWNTWNTANTTDGLEMVRVVKKKSK